MAQPVTPSAAATLVLVRDRPPSAVETLLLQRHAKSKFAAGDYVFAGGKIEADDMPSDGESFCRGLTAVQAAARLGGGLAPGDALACWVGAIFFLACFVGLDGDRAPAGIALMQERPVCQGPA